MKIVKNNQKDKLRYFFEDTSHMDNSFLKAYFQNKAGIGYVDSIINPKSVQVCVGDFSFVVGKPDIAIVKNIKIASQNRGSLIITPDEEWRELYLKHYGEDNICDHYRQSFLSKTNIFDITKLKYYKNVLLKDYCIKPIDERLYHLALEQRWSEDFCINFSTYKEYYENGVGFVVLTKDFFGNDIIVSGASSYIYFDSGIEIQIATHNQYRDKGFATIVGATLILECIARGITPCWDSANNMSSKLAWKLGYRPVEFYKAISIKF